MNRSSIARRYAKALFELAVEEGAFEEIGADLARLRAGLEADPDVLAALGSPSVTREERLGVAEALIGALKPAASLGNALRLLAERARLADLPAIEAAYRELADDRAGRIRAKVVSAVPLTDEAAARLGAALSKATSRNVIVERAIDPTLLGGVVAQVGSQVFDGSVRNQLAQLRQQLKG